MPHKSRKESIYAEALLNPQFLARYHDNHKADTAASRTPPAAERTRTKTSSVRLVLQRAHNYPDRTKPDALSRYDAGSLSMPPCGPCGAICALSAAPPIAIGVGPPRGPASRGRAQPARPDKPALNRVGTLKREKARRGNLPCGPLSARKEKRPPRARRPALPQPRAAVLSAKAGLTAGFGMGPGDPRLCGRARGGRSPAALLYSSLPGTPVRGDPGGRMAGTDRRWRIALGALIEDAKSSGY